jgi:molybdopterin molybdotransferase
VISVADARARVLAAFNALPAETVALPAAFGRVLAEDVAARLTQPRAAVSAMDGWAVRAADVATVPATLCQIGESRAGQGFRGTVSPGDCVRIFTGAPVPDGADAVVIQEDAAAAGLQVTIRESVAAGRHIRPKGLDFRAGDVLLRAGRILTARDIGLAAAMNRPWLSVRRRPRVAILATGDEIVMPGDPLGGDCIVSSNGHALAALVRAAGGEPVDLGIAPDRPDALSAAARGAIGTDFLVTTGGVSVGEHDLVRSVLGRDGLDVDFWKIAMRPGKPLMFGTFGQVPMIGLPGNPVSTLVCGFLFVRAAIEAMLGLSPSDDRIRARLGRDLPANDHREDYLRTTLEPAGGDMPVAHPFAVQDSSMLVPLAAADGLLVRKPHAPALAAGAVVEVLPFAVPSHLW